MKLKKKLKNDNNDENAKEDDIDINEIDSKKKDEEVNDNLKEKKSKEIIGKKKNKSRKTNKQSKILKQRKKKLNIMISFFRRKNIIFYINIILIFFFSFSYYIISMINKSNNKNIFLKFDSLNNNIEKVYNDYFELFIYLIKNVENYEHHLINCTTLGEFHPISIDKINEIKIPKFENLIMQIISSDFSKETKTQFNLLYSGYACKELIDYNSDIEKCESFWHGVISKGIEQAIAQIGTIMGTILDEIQSLNNNRTLLSLINQSSFIEYVEFNEYYLYKAFNKTSNLFIDFRSEKLNSIQKTIKLFLYFYMIIIITLFIILVYFIYNFNNLFTSFLNFIGIFPVKYLSEDENFCHEIIKFGDKYF